MRTVPTEDDPRTVASWEWAEIRLIHTQLKADVLNYATDRATLADLIERLLGECRRLRTESKANYLNGYNDCLEQSREYEKSIPSYPDTSYCWAD